MIRRSTRLTAAVGVSALALAGAGVTTGQVGATTAEEGGWTVDTDDCPDDAVNTPIEGTITIGSTFPLSGPVAGAFESAARGFQAYIAYANGQGLLPGVEIVSTLVDDQYDPSLTPAAVQGLIDDGVNLISGSIGTAQNLTVRDTLNEECIPQLNLLTGDPAWGDDIEEYPWTTGILTPYDKESRGYAESIAATLPDATVGLYYVNNEFGNVYMDAFREAADEAGIEISAEETVENGDNAPPQSQVASLAEAGVGVIVATPLGLQCITFLNELANAKAANEGWEPAVYLTNTCASAQILAGAQANAEGVFTSASMGLVDVGNPEVVAAEPIAGYVAEMEAQGLSDVISVGGAGWNAAEVTVQILIEAANSEAGLTRASIINAARNLNFHPTLLREGMNYVMNGEDDTYYSEDVQVVQYSAADATFTDIGEPYSYESSPDAGDPVVAAPIVAGEAAPAGSGAPVGSEPPATTG